MTNPIPLNPDALEAASKALRDDHANRTEFYVVRAWEKTPHESKELFRAKAKTAVSAYLAVAQPEGWEQQAKNFMRVIDRLTAENEALKAAEQKAHSDAGWAANMDRQGGA